MDTESDHIEKTDSYFFRVSERAFLKNIGWLYGAPMSVFFWMLAKAIRGGPDRGVVRASERDIAVGIQKSRGVALAGLRTLLENGWIERLESGNGGRVETVWRIVKFKGKGSFVRLDRPESTPGSPTIQPGSPEIHGLDRTESTLDRTESTLVLPVIQAIGVGRARDNQNDQNDPERKTTPVADATATVDPTLVTKRGSAKAKKRAEFLELVGKLSPTAQGLIDDCMPTWDLMSFDYDRAISVVGQWARMPEWKVEGGLKKFMQARKDIDTGESLPSWLELRKPPQYAHSIVKGLQAPLAPSPNNGGNGSAKPSIRKRDGPCTCAVPVTGMDPYTIHGYCSACKGKVAHERTAA